MSHLQQRLCLVPERTHSEIVSDQQVWSLLHIILLPWLLSMFKHHLISRMHQIHAETGSKSTSSKPQTTKKETSKASKVQSALGCRADVVASIEPHEERGRGHTRNASRQCQRSPAPSPPSQEERRQFELRIASISTKPRGKQAR